MKIRDLAPFTIRIPPDLKESLQKIAEEKLGGSLNSEILDRLTDSLKDKKELKDFSDGELIDELIKRWGRENVSIRLGEPEK